MAQPDSAFSHLSSEIPLSSNLEALARSRIRSVVYQHIIQNVSNLPINTFGEQELESLHT
jgi:hypothetical protein